MAITASDRTYQAAIYLRLSKDDGDFSASGGKNESDSIANQRLLIKDYLKKHPEIVGQREFKDDGYTGTNFDRPAFQKMLAALQAGELNCVIVKDLSRFGRDYIDVGRYSQKVFPALGVRFIAINDSYDSAQTGNAANDILLPFKSLINDSYSRDISVKVRTNLEVRRRSGAFVGSRVFYGYLRDPENKNHLVVDPCTAPVVQDIFRWKLEGMSPAQIAERLNSDGVLSPIEYKHACGSKQQTCFQQREQALWSAAAIYRILKNEIYTGTLVQGKTATPNFKVKKTVVKDETEWARCEHAHEPIISAAQFDLVQSVLHEDTRRAGGASTIYPFSGKVFCADCGSAMVRKLIRSGTQEYACFLCSGYKRGSGCTPHRIREETVYETVLAVVQAHIAALLDMDAAMQSVESLAWENRELKKLDAKISAQEDVAAENRQLKAGLYADYQSGLVSHEDYVLFKASFDEKVSAAAEAIARLRADRNAIQGGLTEQQSWLAQFRQYQNLKALDRRAVVSLIDRIVIRNSEDIEVHLLYSDQFEALAQFLEEYREKEAG